MLHRNCWESSKVKKRCDCGILKQHFTKYVPNAPPQPFNERDDEKAELSLCLKVEHFVNCFMFAPNNKDSSMMLLQ